MDRITCPPCPCASRSPAHTSLITTGVNGLVVHASTGEPAHLSATEYKASIKTAKSAISDAGGQTTLVVGVSAPSLWQTVERCAYAREFGGDYVLVHAPDAYPLDEEAMARYFRKVSNSGSEEADGLQ